MKALVIGLGLTAAAGVGWYFLSADDSSERSSASANAPAARRAKGSSRAGASDRSDPEPRRDGSLEERVARLEDEVASLRRQLALRGRTAISSDGADIESIVDDPLLDAQVRDILEDEREAERERRNERRLERFEEVRTEALDELVVQARLTQQQREGIDELWASEAERILPLITEARSGDRGFREIRDELEGIRKETDQAAQALLSEAQFEQYDTLRPRGPGRGGRGGGGGRGRGGDRDRGPDEGRGDG